MPHRSGRLAASIKPASTQRTGQVAYSSPTRVPYAGWIEFGGMITTVRGGTIVRPYVKQGRYLFPAAEAERDPILRTLTKSMEDLIKRAGLA